MEAKLDGDAVLARLCENVLELSERSRGKRTGRLQEHLEDARPMAPNKRIGPPHRRHAIFSLGLRRRPERLRVFDQPHSESSRSCGGSLIVPTRHPWVHTATAGARRLRVGLRAGCHLAKLARAVLSEHIFQLEGAN